MDIAGARTRLKPGTQREKRAPAPPPPMRGALFGADGYSAPLTSATAVVHVDYDIMDPPPKPSADWTRFVCISDTHTEVFHVPAGDVLLHSGDLTHTGRLAEVRTTMEWLMGLSHPVKM